MDSADTAASPYIAAAAKVKRPCRTAFPGAVIVRPAGVFASDDAFLTTILRLLRSLRPIRIGDGRTRLPAGVRGRRGCGDRTKFLPQNENHILSTNWRARIYSLRGVVCEPIARCRRIAASGKCGYHLPSWHVPIGR